MDFWENFSAALFFLSTYLTLDFGSIRKPRRTSPNLIQVFPSEILKEDVHVEVLLGNINPDMDVF